MPHTIPPHLTAARLNAQTQGTYRPAAGQAQGLADAEFLGLSLAVYYGVWGHDPAGNGTSGDEGEYDFCDRDAMAAGDPGTVALIESFFAPYLCDRCNLSEEKLLSPTNDFPNGAESPAPIFHCNTCKDTMVFDAVPEIYFYFMSE